MPPTSTPHEEDDDLDDLDGLVSEFQSQSLVPPSPAAVSSSPASSSSPSAPSPSATADQEEDFPDPEDDALLDDLDDAAFAKEIEDGMAQFMKQFGGEDAAELQKVMDELIGGAGPAGSSSDPATLLAALTGASPSPSAVGPSAPRARTVPSSTPTASGSSPTATFQDTIAQAMNKMRDSSTAVDAETEARAASTDDPLAALMAQMGGLEGLDGLDGPGLQGMLDEMMESLMSRELLYTPLKELSTKYPDYLSTNASKLSAADLTRFKKQQIHVAAIVAKFEEPGAEKETSLTPDEEARAKERTKEVADLVKAMNDCGAPPAEIMGEMPEGMELGPDGVPKLPADCTIS